MIKISGNLEPCLRNEIDPSHLCQNWFRIISFFSCEAEACGIPTASGRSLASSYCCSMMITAKGSGTPKGREPLSLLWKPDFKCKFSIDLVVNARYCSSRCLKWMALLLHQIHGRWQFKLCNLSVCSKEGKSFARSSHTWLLGWGNTEICQS